MIRNATYALLCAAALLAGSVSAADKPMLARAASPARTATPGRSRRTTST